MTEKVFVCECVLTGRETRVFFIKNFERILLRFFLFFFYRLISFVSMLILLSFVVACFFSILYSFDLISVLFILIKHQYYALTPIF